MVPTTASRVKPQNSTSTSKKLQTDRCGMTMPFGSPVLPEVKTI